MIKTVPLKDEVSSVVGPYASFSLFVSEETTEKLFCRVPELLPLQESELERLHLGPGVLSSPPSEPSLAHRLHWLDWKLDYRETLHVT